MDDFVVRAVRAEEQEACLDLWCAVWPGAGSPAYFRRYFEGDVEWLPYYTQVGVLNGKIVSAVQICKRTVACGDFRLTMGGIANVATLPEYRGRGYNTQCLQRAMAVMEADAMDFSLLFTGIHDYYARQGYETLPRMWLSGTIGSEAVLHSKERSSNQQAARDTYTVRGVEADDLPGIQAIYSDYNARLPIAVQRWPAYWRDWINISPRHLPDNLLVAVSPGGEVCGYVNSGVFKSAIPYSPDAAGTSIIELGVKGGLSAQEENDVTTALMEAAASNARAAAQTLFRLQVALTPAVVLAFSRIVIMPQQTHVNTSGMVRLLHRENLLQSVTMGLNDRWIGAGRPSGSLVFNTPYGATRLDATGTFLRVQAVEQNEAEGEMLSQSTLFGLLFGILAPEQATKDEGLHPLLLTLFPPQAHVYYGADGF